MEQKSKQGISFPRQQMKDYINEMTDGILELIDEYESGVVDHGDLSGCIEVDLRKVFEAGMLYEKNK